MNFFMKHQSAAAASRALLPPQDPADMPTEADRSDLYDLL